MPNNPDITFHAKQIFCSGSQTDIMLFYNRQYKLYQKVKKHHLQHQQSVAIRQKKFIVSSSICSYFFFNFKIELKQSQTLNSAILIVSSMLYQNKCFFSFNCHRIIVNSKYNMQLFFKKIIKLFYSLCKKTDKVFFVKKQNKIYVMVVL